MKSTNSRELLGGLVGRMDYAKVSKCSANLEITGSFNTTGGLIGQMSNQNEGPNIVENSYAVGSIRGNRTNALKKYSFIKKFTLLTLEKYDNMRSGNYR